MRLIARLEQAEGLDGVVKAGQRVAFEAREAGGANQVRLPGAG